MILALTAFVLLASLAVMTDGFSSATRVQLGLAVVGWLISVVALADAVAALLLLITGAIVLGFMARPPRRR